MRSLQHLRRPAWALLALVLAASALTGCGGSGKAPTLVMPDVVGMKIGNAEANVYDELHTSLSYYDLSPADRDATNDWVVVATLPAAGVKTPKYKTVYAWALKASEAAWFKAHPTMPKFPAKATVAQLTAPGGLLEPVRDLVLVRYQPGKAPKSARPSAADAAPFHPDRGIANDLSLEPEPEWGLRKGLLVAPVAGTVAVASSPAAGTELRVGQYLVVLGIPKPKHKKVPPAINNLNLPYAGGSSSGGGSSGGGGSGGSGTGGLPGIKVPHLPGCPKSICG